MFQSNKRIAIRSSANKSAKRVHSSYLTSPFGLGGGNVNTQLGFSGLNNIKDGMLDGIAPTNQQALFDIYKDIYYHDSIAGAAVDMMSTLPFSDWTLSGANEEQLEVFESNLDRLNMRALMPEMSVDFLVLGTFLATLVFKKKEKLFTDLIPQNISDCTVIPTPLYGTDPLIKMRIGDDMREFINSREPHIERLKERLSPDMLKAMHSPEVSLDPLTTLYVPRRSFTFNNTGTSLFHRLLPIYFLERILYRGTLTEATKRQRSILHVIGGDEDWEPTDTELKSLLALFQQADLDPIGAMIATRDDVSTSEIRCLAGSTIIHTDNGLIPIKDLVDHNPETMEPGTKVELTNTFVRSQIKDYGRVSYWWFHGKKPVFDMMTEDGLSTRATSNHRFVTLGKDCALQLVRTEDSKGKFIIKGTEFIPNTNYFGLSLKTPDTYMEPGDILLPTCVTPKLAYCLGILANNYIKKTEVSVINNDEGVLDQYEKFMGQIFNVKGFHRGVSSETVRVRHLEDRQLSATQTIYTSSISSEYLVYILDQLGLKTLEPNNTKEMPICIMQSDSRSQRSFLSGYLDGTKRRYDTKGCSFSFESASQQMSIDTHLVLSDLGILSTLTLNDEGASSVSLSWVNNQVPLLVEDLPYSIRCKKASSKDGTNYHLGVPGIFVVESLENRVISNEVGPNKEDGTWFNGDNETVFIPGDWKKHFKRFLYSPYPIKYPAHRNVLSYDKYLKGDFDEVLTLVKTISSIFYANLLKLFQRRYKFLEVKSVKPAGTEYVYDLTMNKNVAPLFLANSLISKNSGGDFWKWTDVIPETSNLKMQALGINEGFLCLAEGSLIHTEHGLIPIEDLIPIGGLTNRDKLKKNQMYPIHMYIKGISGYFRKVTHWWYRGFSKVYNTTTKSGYAIKTTNDHKVLTLGEDFKLIWVKVKHLRDDYLCLDTKGFSVDDGLTSFKLSDPVLIGDKQPTAPTRMTPDLAFILGKIMCKGVISEDAIILNYSDSNQFSITRQKDAFFKVFGITLKKGTTSSINSLKVENKQVIQWVLELLDLNKVPSSSCEPGSIPFTILGSQSECRLAFLAAFLESSGFVYVYDDEINVRFCIEPELINQIQVLLADLGIISSRKKKQPTFLNVTGHFGAKLYSKLKPWTDPSKVTNFNIPNEKKKQGFGIPLKVIQSFLTKRWLRTQVNEGELFMDADKQLVLIKQFGKRMQECLGQDFYIKKDFVLPYSEFDAGTYNDLLDILHELDSKAYKRLCILIKQRYFFDPVSSVKPAGKSHLYDLSMDKDAQPAFVSNGIVVHNSGDMSYGTMEVALSVFIEHMKAFREMVTHRVFYNKLFPLISVIHDFQSEQEAHPPNPYYRHKSKEQSAYKSPMLTTDMVQWDISDTSKLVIPTLNWHKALRPEADTEYLSVLETLTEKGVPVPLRMWAAAGGLSVDSLMTDLKEDEEIKAKIKELTGKDPDDDYDDDEFSFANLRGKGIKKQNILDRDFGDLSEVTSTTRTGKKKAVLNQTRANRKINDKIIKAAKGIAEEPNNIRRKRMTQKLMGKRNPYGV